jgi:predicted DNA-binding transcriptional regulator
MGASDREPTVSDEEILWVFVQYDDAGLEAREVAEELPIERDNLNDRLDDLYERGLLDSEETSRGTVWSIEPDAADDLSVSDVETAVESQAENADLETSPHRRDARSTGVEMPEDEPIGDAEEPTTDHIEAIDLPGPPDQQEDRREALRAAYRYLRDGASATKDGITNEVFADHPAGYDDPDDGWWQQVVRPGLVALSDIEQQGDEWRFVGDEDTNRTVSET